MINYWKFRIYDMGNTFLQAFNTMLFLSFSGSTSKSCINFMLYLLPLISGLLLTNFYNCNLSSMLTLKVYEPPLRRLTDVARTNLSIIEHTADTEHYKNYELPAIIYDRLYSGNNSVLYQYRKQLKVNSYIYTAQEDISSFLFLQQRYLKKPMAKLLDEPTYTRPIFITMSLRSPLISHFNRYLLYIKESGILNKLILDSDWDGIRSGEIKFFKDPDVSKSLTLEYFMYAFVIWSSGLVMALLYFLKEILWKKKIVSEE